MKKIAIVTGASSGMGWNFALYLKDFFDFEELWIIARRKDRLEELKNFVQEKYNNLEVKIINEDISGRNGILRFKSILNEETKKSTFTIEILVNNAGFGTYGTFDDTDLEKELDMIDLNVSTLTGFCGICIPYMKENSTIINTASLAAFLPLGNFAVYAATKAYALSFSVALNAELKHKKIKVCAFCPGSVKTEFANVASNGSRKEVKGGYDCKKTVLHCLKSAKKEKTIIIYAIKWKIAAFLSRFIGKSFGAKFTERHNKRPNGKNGISP